MKDQGKDSLMELVHKKSELHEKEIVKYQYYIIGFCIGALSIASEPINQPLGNNIYWLFASWISWILCLVFSFARLLLIINKFGIDKEVATITMVREHLPRSDETDLELDKWRSSIVDRTKKYYSFIPKSSPYVNVTFFLGFIFYIIFRLLLFFKLSSALFP
jgi:hypothetical protein